MVAVLEERVGIEELEADVHTVGQAEDAQPSSTEGRSEAVSDGLDVGGELAGRAASR